MFLPVTHQKVFSFFPRRHENDSARAEYLHNLAHSLLIVDDKDLRTPEDLEEHRRLERQHPGPRLQLGDNLGEIVFLDLGKNEPLDHVEPHSPDEEEPEVDFGDDNVVVDQPALTESAHADCCLSREICRTSRSVHVGRRIRFRNFSIVPLLVQQPS